MPLYAFLSAHFDFASLANFLDLKPRRGKKVINAWLTTSEHSSLLCRFVYDCFCFYG